MKTRTILSTLLAGLLVASLAAPALAGQGKKQNKNNGAVTSGKGDMTKDKDQIRLKDGSCK